jgi:hypothetical protein
MATEKDTLEFIVIGAQKAGTTSLFQYLKRHPEISLPAGKEWPYFSNDPVYTRGWNDYLTSLVRNGYGEAADPVRKWGTVTPQYMVGGVYQSTDEAGRNGGYDERTVPLRIHERLPNVRLIAILRDPVARAISHHRMGVMVGRERRSFDHAIGELLSADALEDARRRPDEATGYIAWGEYGRILSGYFEVFAADQILVAFTDELESAPAALLCHIHEFIGVRADFEPDNLGERYREKKVERVFSWASPSSWLSPTSPVSPQGVQRALRHNPATRALWHAIPQDRQRRLRRPYERIANRAVHYNRRAPANDVTANSEPSPETVARLREHYQQDADQLAALLGVTPSWLAAGTEHQDDQR